MDILEQVKSHNLTKLKEIDAEEIKNAECDNDGLTPLHWSSRKGFLDVVEFLVELGVDIFKLIKYIINYFMFENTIFDYLNILTNKPIVDTQHYMRQHCNIIMK